MRVAITGATGLLGRNLLFEIIKQNLGNLRDLEIFVLGRDAPDNNIHGRIEQIILNDGVYYISADNKEIAENVKKYCKIGIKEMNIDLIKENIGIESEDMKQLKSNPIDFFYHVAASTDLRGTPASAKLLRETNIYGTQQILKLASLLKIGEFCYVGTAYSYGDVSGNVEPVPVDTCQVFRNPYEETKAKSEVLVREFAKEKKVRCRYFRPSSVCGRLLENPLGATSKFDVFYAWGAFFLHIKLKKMDAKKDKYKEPFVLDVRACYNLKGGLNIVPVDYVAKVMYQVCIQNDPGEIYHLVNDQECPHSLYLNFMLNSFNIQGVKQVDNIPDDMNDMERLYYKTVGKQFTPYINAKPMLFSVENLKNVLAKASLRCPQIDKKALCILVDYAKKYDFGMTNIKSTVNNHTKENIR